MNKSIKIERYRCPKCGYEWAKALPKGVTGIICPRCTNGPTINMKLVKR